MKFILFVEGQTEKGAVAELVKRWLDPRLPRPVRIFVVDAGGVGNYLNDIANLVEFYLESQLKEQVIAGIGLLDFSGTSFSTPAAGKSELEKRVAHPRFRQHFAVHETEAWLLAHKEILPRGIREALPARCSQPELINTNEPPSRLLRRLYQQHLNRPYKKVLDGKKLFLECDPNVVAEKCPHFSQMLIEMEQLAKAAM